MEGWSNSRRFPLRFLTHFLSFAIVVNVGISKMSSHILRCKKRISISYDLHLPIYTNYYLMRESFLQTYTMYYDVDYSMCIYI